VLGNRSASGLFMGFGIVLSAELADLEVVSFLEHISDQVIFQVDAFESFLVKLDRLLFRGRFAD